MELLRIHSTMSHTQDLASFPHLADSEFEEACSALLRKFVLHGHGQNEWISVDVASHNEITYMRIVKPLALHLEAPGAGNETEEVELSEDDDEVAQTLTSSGAAIHYDVMLSLSYRVPVLYFTVSDILHRYPPTLETLNLHITPATLRAQAEHVGVIGGITVTDHPATNKPVFFIHPCRTAEVMEASVGGRDITAYDYLVMWIGALGSYVGLNVPVALVTQTL